MRNPPFDCYVGRRPADRSKQAGCLLKAPKLPLVEDFRDRPAPSSRVAFHDRIQEQAGVLVAGDSRLDIEVHRDPWHRCETIPVTNPPVPCSSLIPGRSSPNSVAMLGHSCPADCLPSTRFSVASLSTRPVSWTPKKVRMRLAPPA